ncbi:hypothetical protein Ciccas_007094 [Cichlidogyrus casuarinus]|uniref:Rho-GAP domain-containing protein n=1 Tax=Cichlidogyrus casuarinus TaxID=1844966 RepID=A0ABD2Q563_9PLAT
MNTELVRLATEDLLTASPHKIVSGTSPDNYLAELSHLIELPLDISQELAQLRSSKCRRKAFHKGTLYLCGNYCVIDADRLVVLKAIRDELLNGNKLKIYEVMSSIKKALRKNSYLGIAEKLVDLNSHDLAGLLKSYLCFLNQSKNTQIIPGLFANLFSGLTDEVDKLASSEQMAIQQLKQAKCVKAFRLINSLLPENSRNTLELLIRFGMQCLESQQVLACQQRQTPESLGILLGPSLFPPEMFSPSHVPLIDAYQRSQLLTKFLDLFAKLCAAALKFTRMSFLNENGCDTIARNKQAHAVDDLIVPLSSNQRLKLCSAYKEDKKKLLAEELERLKQLGGDAGEMRRLLLLGEENLDVESIVMAVKVSDSKEKAKRLFDVILSKTNWELSLLKHAFIANQGVELAEFLEKNVNGFLADLLLKRVKRERQEPNPLELTHNLQNVNVELQIKLIESDLALLEKELLPLYQFIEYSRGSVLPSPYFRDNRDAKLLESALNGRDGLSVNDVIKLMAGLTSSQRIALMHKFNADFRTDLKNIIKTRYNGDFEKMLLMSLLTNEDLEYEIIENAVNSKKDEKIEAAFIDVILPKTNYELYHFSQHYKYRQGSELMSTIKRSLDSNGFLYEILAARLSSNRDEPHVMTLLAQSHTQLIDSALITSDVELIKNVIMPASIMPWLEWELMTRCSWDWFLLEARQVSHLMSKAYFQIDLEDIKKEYALLYRKSLLADVHDETSGDYQKYYDHLIGG